MESARQIRRNIYKVGVPSFLETLFTTFASIIDSKMVSALGTAAISAVAVTNQPRLFVFSVFFALNTVASSLSAKYYGKGDREAANRVLDHVLKLVVILSVIFSILTVIFARPIMIAFAKQPDTLDDSVIYFRIVMGGMIFNLLYMAINSALRGIGKTNLTFFSNLASCVVNIFFNYLLIEGHLGCPAMGVAGAAIATVMGTVAAFAISLIFACRSGLFVNIPYCIKQKYHMTKDSLKEITGLAKSTFADSFAMRLSLLIIGSIVAHLGSHQHSVYAVGMHLMNVNFALGTGFQTAGVALIGKNFGAGDKDAMRAYKNTIMVISLITSSVLGVAIIVTGRLFFGLFSDSKAFIMLGTASAVFIGFNTIVQTTKFSYMGFLQGVGAMKQVMVSSLWIAVFNPLLLVILVNMLGMGLYGVWIASLASQTLQAVVLIYYYRKNKEFKRDRS